MKVKGISYSDVKATLLQDPDVLSAYLAEKKKEEMREFLINMRKKAGLNSSQVAEKMGISQPAVSKLENNAINASLSRLERYAEACGTSLKISSEDGELRLF
ncbi:helix-turn-helix transcriptional regulator [Xenorhabdus khoisanae]|uniref:helix-turn-helix domain-containing protein n=1 Tax=Xenorhabdus khoisanae TaxID=880157 RepID=UPI0032B74A70